MSQPLIWIEAVLPNHSAFEYCEPCRRSHFITECTSRNTMIRHLTKDVAAARQRLANYSQEPA